EVTLAEVPPRRLPTKRERLGQQVVERLAVASALPELVGLGADLPVLEQLHLRLDAIDRGDPPLVLLELARLAQAQRAIYQPLSHFAEPSSGLTAPCWLVRPSLSPLDGAFPR